MRVLGSLRLAPVAAGAFVVSSCASIGLAEPPPAPEGLVQQLIFPAESVGSIPGLVNYNPYALTPLTSTWLYEPLMIRDQFTCEVIPWLATAYEWVDAATLVFTIRDGVTFSDGEPFTADDVAFTFNLGKEYPSVDRGGLWGDFFGAAAESVTVEGNRVVIRFGGNAAAKFDNIIAYTKIIPEHIYSGVGDPTAYIDENPAGTGPFVVSDYNGRRLTLTRNEAYWQADTIRVNSLALEGSYDVNSAALKLRNGDLDAYFGDIPNPELSVVDADEHNAYYYAPAGTTVLALNNEQAPMSDPAFRAAIAAGIDKEQIAVKGTFGVMDVASQTMLKLPVQADDIPEAYQSNQGVLPFSTDEAKAQLDAAGYTVGEDGWRTNKDGSSLELTFSVQAGWVDYQAMADVIVRNLRAMGLNAQYIATDPNAVDSQKKSGDFDMLLDYVHGGCSRGKDMGGKLDSEQISDGTDLLLNVARYNNPATDAVIEELEASTDPAEQEVLTDQLIDVFMNEVPYIALVYAPQRIIYRTENAVGWPSVENPYPPDALLRVMTELTPPPAG